MEQATCRVPEKTSGIVRHASYPPGKRGTYGGASNCPASHSRAKQRSGEDYYQVERQSSRLIDEDYPIQSALFRNRISFDVTAKEHQRLKSLAALQGKSMKDYVIDCTLRRYEATGETAALKELEVFLDNRIRDAQNGAVSRRMVGGIFRKAYRERTSK